MDSSFDKVANQIKYFELQYYLVFYDMKMTNFDVLRDFSPQVERHLTADKVVIKIQIL